MRLKQPNTVREKLLKRRQVATIKEIAKLLKMSNHTIAKVLSGGSAKPATIRRIAGELGVSLGDIATFTEETNK
jgi:transcriptional regulator with XRE-family HTH domain